MFMIVRNGLFKGQEHFLMVTLSFKSPFLSEKIKIVETKQYLISSYINEMEISHVPYEAGIKIKGI